MGKRNKKQKAKGKRQKTNPQPRSMYSPPLWGSRGHSHQLKEFYKNKPQYFKFLFVQFFENQFFA